MTQTVYCHICKTHHRPDEPSHESALVAGGFGAEVLVGTTWGRWERVLRLTPVEARQLLGALVYLEHEHGTLGPDLGRVKLELSDELGDDDDG